MADYYVGLDGKVTKKKKKANYTVSLDGKIIENTIEDSANDTDIAPIVSDEPEKEKRSWFSGGGFSDGYDFGDVTKTILGTTKDLEDNIYAGVIGMGEKVVDAGAYVVGGAGGLVGADGFKDKMQKFIKKDLYDEEAVASKITPFVGVPGLSNISNMVVGEEAENYSVLGEKTDSLAQSGGQLMATIGLQAVGVPWFVTTGATSFGGEVDNAFKKDATYGEAGISATIKAGADILTEKLFGGSGLGEKGLINLEPLTKGISNKAVKILSDYGIDILAEGSEEVVAEFVSNLGEQLTYEKEDTWNELLNNEEAMDNYISQVADSLFGKEAREGYTEAFIGGAVLGGGANSVNVAKSLQSGRDYRTGLTDNEQKVVDAEVESRIKEAEADNKTLNSKEKAEIQEEVMNDLKKGNINIDVIESVLGGETYESYKSISDKETSLKEEIAKLESDPRPTAQNRLEEARTELEAIEKGTQKTELKDKLSLEVQELTRNELLSESYNEKARRSQKYEADITKYDAKQQETVKKAIESGILNNTNKTHDFVDLIAKLSAEKGVLFDFTNNENLKKSGYAVEGATVNGLVNGNDIILNIDSNKALNTVVGHEITHILEGTDLYTELQNAVKEYATTKGEYSTRLEAIQKLYEGKNADIDAELTADLVGDYLFTDSDFINNLSTQKPNIFKKIYEEIKYLYKLATAGSKEARQLEKVKKAFDKAFKEGPANVRKAYDISEDANLRKYITDALSGNLPKKSYYKISEKISERLADDIEKIVGFSVKDYGNEISPNHIKHINDRHGENGKSDHSMKDISDVARMGYVIENYDRVIKGDVNREYKNKDGSPSQNIILQKKLDDNYYYVVEAVPDANKKILHVVSAYINKNDTFPVVDNANSPIRNVQNEPQSNVSFNNNIPQNTKNTSEVKKELTKEQQEYFKDSVVRDENGNLKPMYHGTSKGGHTVFDPYGASKYGLFGVGSYFTDNKSVAESYTEKGKGNNKQIYETYLNITNPIDMDAQANPEAWKKAMPEVDFPKEGTNEDFYRAMEEHLADNEYARWEASEIALETLESMGYDGITHIGGGRFNKADDTRHQVYIAFHSEQIKNIDNRNPTTDADIRYSLSEDSEGKKLSDEQKEYFKDSKIVDENGQLKVMYHGSPASFTVFDKKKAKSSGYYGRGFYFSESESHAGQYGRKYEVYLNIKNPMREGTNDITKEQLKKFVNEVAENEDYGIENYGYDATVDSVTNSVYGKDDFSMIMDINATSIGDMVEAIQLFNEVNGTNYDGIIVPTETVAFYPNQIKSITNQNPTDNPDINLSLSDKTQNIAPTGNYNVYGKYIALETPVKEIVQEKTDLAQGVVQDSVLEEYAPLTEAQANERDAMQSDRVYSLTESDMLDEVEAPYNEPMEAVSPFDEKDIKDVGDRKQKAYMYENPEVRPYFQEEAQVMLGELRNSIKGEKHYNDQLYYDTNGEQGWFGTKRETSEQIAYMLDNFKYTYADIEKGLNAIIEDHGAENNAISKRLEFMIDERLREGYTDFVSGMEIPSNQDYINLLIDKQINEYSDEAYNQYLESLAFAEATAVEDIAPTKEYEAIEPRPENLDALEKQWAKNKMTRADSKKSEFEEIAKVLDAEPVTESDRNNRKWAIFKANVLDKGAVFEDLALKTKNRNIIGKWNYTLYSEARAQRLMGNGDAEAGVKSLNDIRAEVENTGLTQEFYEYMYHKHNVDRMKLEERYGAEDNDIKNKPVFGYSVTADVSQEIVDQYEFARPEFMEYAKDVYNYQNYLRQQLVDSGVISQETSDLWSDMYPHYVPIRRVTDSNANKIDVPLFTGRTSVNAPIKKATGGNTDILPLFDTMAMRTMQTYKATAKNSFGVELKNALGTTVEKGDTNIDEVIDSIDTQDSLLQEGKHGQKPTFTVFENGERVTFEITEDMYDAFKPLGDSSFMSKTIKPLNVASNFHRGLLTEYNPVFILTNGIKDIQDVLINSQHPARTYAKVPESFAQLLTKGYWYNEYMNNGGDSNSYFDSDTNTFKTENKGLAKLLDLPPLSTISKLNNYVEMIPRLAEYIASREAGRSIEVSMLDSARVTTNFRAGGDLTKFLNRNGATFLNASVQGAMQQIRNVREAKANGLKGWVNLATKFAIAGLPAYLLNALLWDDDEEYEELSDYVKQNYYIVGKYDDGKFIRIPKGRTVAVIQDAIKQVSNLATGDDEADLKSFLQLVVTNLAPANPIENNILAPIIQAKNNETWYGEDLVPTRLQDLPASEQYDESTDKFSKFLGEKLDISPVKINYLLDQYSGGLGDVVLPMLTPEAESGDNSLAGNIIAPLKKKFTADSVMNNQNVSDFYETSEELTTNAKMSTATDEDVLKNKYINSVKAEMSELYKEKREIQNSDLPDAEKYAQVREIQSQIVDLSKEGLKAYKGVDISGDYATVGNRHYKRNEGGEWTKITDKQLEKQEEVTTGLGISPSDYWSKKEEYDYAYENPEKYAMTKALGGFDTYKTYTSALNDIKADKDESGKSINGSRKEKVLNYVNGLNADYGEKILLFKSEYPADDTYNYDIIEYLNNKEDISYSDMEIILKELGFTVDADGTISW